MGGDSRVHGFAGRPTKSKLALAPGECVYHFSGKIQPQFYSERISKTKALQPTLGIREKLEGVNHKSYVVYKAKYMESVTLLVLGEYFRPPFSFYRSASSKHVCATMEVKYDVLLFVFRLAV